MYFGTSDPPDFIRNQTGATYDPPGDLSFRSPTTPLRGDPTLSLWSHGTDDGWIEDTNQESKRERSRVSVGVTRSWDDTPASEKLRYVYFGTSDPTPISYAIRLGLV